MRVIFDAEGDGLEPTKFWCISIIDYDSREVSEYGPSDIKDALEHLAAADVLIGHHILGYDVPNILKLYGLDLYDKDLIDTLVLSRLINPTQEGGHSLAAWGHRLGFAKVEHEDWTKYSKAMQHRCTVDARLNLKVFRELEKSLTHFSSESVELEHSTYKIIHKQMNSGWQFDTKGAQVLLAKVQDDLGRTEDKVRETFLPKQFPVKEVVPQIKQDGTLSKTGLTAEEYNSLLASGDYQPFTRYRTQVFNLGSRQQIALWLQDFGWKPTKLTAKGSVEVNDKILSEIQGIPEADLINHYLTVSKIQGFLENWLASVKDDGRQHGYVNPNGAVTGRMTHSKPNLGQVPSSRKLYGKECRQLFIVKEGYKLVGMDADGLELRMLAHYMNDPDYIDAVVNGDKDKGTDAHSVNMRAAGLSDRDQAKTMFYALIYGAGDVKMGSIIDSDKKGGKELKRKLFKGLPALEKLIQRVQAAAERGFIKGLDGRLIRIRSIHAALNTLLQGAGAVVMKRALIILDQKATAAGLDYQFVGNIHDEIQTEVRETQTEQFSALALEAMKEAGEYYNLNCPLKGDVSIGNNWSETH